METNEFPPIVLLNKRDKIMKIREEILNEVETKNQKKQFEKDLRLLRNVASEYIGYGFMTSTPEYQQASLMLAEEKITKNFVLFCALSFVVGSIIFSSSILVVYFIIQVNFLGFLISAFITCTSFLATIVNNYDDNYTKDTNAFMAILRTKKYLSH